MTFVRLTSLLALGLGLGLAACSSGADLDSELQCRASRECDNGLACSFNFCVDPRPNHLTLMARIIPPPATGLLPQQVPALTALDGPDLLVRLLGSAHVRGVVTQRGSPSLINVPGDLEVRAEDVLAGFEHRFTASSIDGLRDGYGYDLVVLPGRSYTGTFRPADPEIPRMHFVLDEEAVQAGRFDLVLPARSEYRTVRGSVRRENATPVLGARVVVLGEGSEVAAVTETDGIRGMFEVLIAPGIDKVRLEIEAPLAGPVFPDYVTDALDVAEDIIVVVPEPPLDVAAYDASIQVLAPDGSPAAGLSVTLQGVLIGGTIRRTALTDADGRARFNVLAGPYECLVVSPLDSPWASWHGFKDLGPEALATGVDRGTVIQLEARPTLSARVVDAFGRPVTSGTLMLERDISRQDGEVLVIAPPAVKLELDASGAFSVRVDPGSWDLVVAPDPSTGAPHTHESDIEVGPDGLDLELGLPEPGLLHLTVAGPEGPFLSGVTVELWLPDEDSDTPRLLARGTTGEQGFVDLLIPHEDTP